MKNTKNEVGGNYWSGWGGVFAGKVIISLFVFTATSLHAAVITWSTPTNCSADTDVMTIGAATYAYDWSSAKTVNGVAFAVAGSATAASTNVTLTFANTTSTAYTNTTSGSAFNALSSVYKSVLTGGAYKDASGVSATVTLNNLQVGHTYVVQYWVSDPRGVTRQETLTSSGGNTVTCTYCSTGSTAGGVGVYSSGSFTAGATSQAFTVTTVGSGGDVQVNALQVRDTTGALPANYWGGYVNGNWDSTTTNWGYGQSFTAVTGAYSNANFADVNDLGNAVVNTNITVQSPGVSIGTVNFLNNSVNYIITNASGTAGITGSSAMVKSGSGMLTLAGVNTYTGLTTVNNGVLNLFGNQSLATGGWYLGSSLNNVVTVNFEPGSAVCIASSGAVSLDQTYGALSYGANLNVTGDVTNNGSLNIQRAGALAVNSGGEWTQNGGMTVGPNGYTSYSASLTINGGAFIYAGTGNVNLNSSAFAGGSSVLAVAGGGTFITEQPFANATGSGTGSGNITLGDATVAASGTGTLQLSTNVTTLIAASGVGFNLQLGAAGGVFDTAGFSTTINVAIGNVGSQSGSLAVTGGGTLTLAGTNTYTGATTISAGNLLVAATGSLASSMVTVSGSGAALELAQSAALTNTVVLVVNPNASVTVDSGVNQTVGGLCLGGQWVPQGTWGSTASGAANQNNTWFNGTGIITVSHGSAPTIVPSPIFTYETRSPYYGASNPAPGVISYMPFPGWDYPPFDYINLDTYTYEENHSASSGAPVAIFFIDQTSPLSTNVANNGYVRSNSVSDTVSWFTTNNPSGDTLNYVLSDFEPYAGESGSVANVETEVSDVVAKVRGSANTNVSTAYIGNYGEFPGASDPALSFASRPETAAEYLSSGLNVAQPNAYAYAAYAANGPNARSGYFWSDLEMVSYVKLNLPAGNKLLPWVNAMTTIPDGDALLAHMRLRGVDGYCDLGGLLNQSYAWSDLDWLFHGTGSGQSLNLTTTEASGFQWSGYQMGPNFAFLFSNLGGSAGSVNLPSYPDLPAASPTIAAGNHTTIDYINDPTCIATNTIFLGRDGINHGLYVNDTATLTNAIQVVAVGTNDAAAVTIGSDLAGNFSPTFSGPLGLNNNVTFQGLGIDTVFSGSISGTGAVTTVGNVFLAGTNSYSGGTTISSGDLLITNANALGNGNLTIPKGGTNSGTLLLALAGSSFIFNSFNGFDSTTFTGDSTVPDIENVSGTNSLTSNLTVTGTGGNGVTIKADAGLLQLDGTISTSLTYRGVELNGAGNGLVAGSIVDGSGGIVFGVVKDGAGTWTLSGTNTYSGGTSVNNGTLLVNGSIGSGSVLVSSNATLGGTGTANGVVTLNGAVSPGNGGVGTLATGNETWNGGGTYQFGLNNATNSAGWDLLNINGTLNVQATVSVPFTINLISLTSSNAPGPVAGFTNGSTAWTIATASGGIQNFDPTVFIVNTTAFSNTFSGSFSVGTNGNSLVVLFTNTNPPETMSLLNNAPSFSAGAFSFDFSGPNGQPYRVLASTNLSLPLANWEVLASGTFGNDPISFTDSSATNGQEYYQVTSP